MTSFEDQLRAAGARPQQFGESEPSTSDTRREAQNLAAITAELDASPESRLARVLRRLGVPDLTVPLITATPALRRSWFVAVGIALVFALSASSNRTGDPVEQIVVFLTLAPLVPLLGVALAFGSGVDPTHELVLAAPRDTFGVFVIRAVTVLTASTILLSVASVLLPVGGVHRVAWLLPSLALASMTAVLSVREDPRRVAAVVGAAWIGLVIIVSRAASSAAMFGPVTQIASLVIAIAALSMLIAWRARFDVGAGS